MYDTTGLGHIQDKISALTKAHYATNDVAEPCNCNVRPNPIDKFEKVRYIDAGERMLRLRRYKCPNCLSRWDAVEVPIGAFKTMDKLPPPVKKSKSRLSRETRREILTRLYAGERYKDVAKDYGISISTASHALSARIWTDIDRSGMVKCPPPKRGAESQLSYEVRKRIVIESMTQPLADLAEKYGLHRSTISQAKAGRIWPDINRNEIFSKSS